MTIKSFMEELESKTVAHPCMDARCFMHSQEDYTSVELKPFDGKILLGLIHSPYHSRGKGFASTTLDRVLDMAIRHKVQIVGGVEDCGGLNRTQLKRWYRRHGCQVEWRSGAVSFDPFPGAETLQNGNQIQA